METRKIQAELTDAGAVAASWEASGQAAEPLTEAEIRAALGGAGAMFELYVAVYRADRAAVDRALVLQLRYTKQAQPGLKRYTPGGTEK